MINPVALTARALSVGTPTVLGFLVGDLTFGQLGAVVAGVIGASTGIAIEVIRSFAAARTERIKLIEVVNNEHQAQFERSEKIHAQQIKFYQESLRYRASLEVIARDNAHNAMAEVWRCQLQIRVYEDMLKDANVAFEHFEIRGYDELRGGRELPSPPQVEDVSQ